MIGYLRRMHANTRATQREVTTYLRRITAIEVARELDRLRDRSERTGDPLRLTRHEQKVFSQFGEDGITLEIFRRIGVTNRFFVEFGIGNGLENNTVYLLMTGWHGLWMDLDDGGVAHVRREFAGELADQTLRLLRIDHVFCVVDDDHTGAAFRAPLVSFQGAIEAVEAIRLGARSVAIVDHDAHAGIVPGAHYHRFSGERIVAVNANVDPQL